MASPSIPNNPDNYMSPSALSIWFAALDSDGALGTWRDLGNVFDIAIAGTEEYLDHESARNGLMSKDKTTVSKLSGTVNFTIDELVGCNLLYMMRPTTDVDTTAVDTVLDQKRIRLPGSTAKTIDVRAVEVAADDYLALGWDDSILDVLVRSADGTVMYTEGVDYTFTQAVGTWAASGSTRVAATIARIPAGDIVDNAQVTVTYEYDREASEYKMQEGAIMEGSLRVQALNLIGPMFAYEFPYVSLKLNGEQAINPAEYLKQPMQAEILTDGDGERGAFYIYDVFNKLSAASC